MPHRCAVPAALLAAGTVAAATVLVGGCSPSQVHGCTGVSPSVRDTRVGRLTDDLPLAATLTAHGRLRCS
ncbi:hypothetical protein [Actinacidiphila rubida]|uniref:Lipoprotein n=1 Tax=Actinacidiphila rubida TaxID=310780 RepID=A0A1H8JC63_9ACTN|nr:hypothetical protein [Actinacidiphila rubida]SEN78463.1 hypothetical protein SAMN05216267_101042 [Actinacidiphila rubida]